MKAAFLFYFLKNTIIFCCTVDEFSRLKYNLLIRDRLAAEVSTVEERLKYA